jgi:hypothetical protein
MKYKQSSRYVGAVVLCAVAAVTSARATDLQVRYSYFGDANLDGTVNTADFTSLASNFGSATTPWAQGDFNYDGKVNSLDFNAIATNFGVASPTIAAALPVDSYQSTLFTTATVRFDNHRRDDQKLNIDTSWLPHVLAAQQAEAGIKLNTEALKALAVADRSLLYYTLGQKGWITSGHGAPDCDLTLTPTKDMKTAATFTEREFLQFDNAPLIGYVANGDSKSKQYVTDNFNLSENDVQPTSLGSARTDANRGALSIISAEKMAEEGADYVDILKHFYGDDAQLALGTYKTSFTYFAQSTGNATGAAAPSQAHVKMLSNFEHDDGLLGPAAIKHVAQTYVADSSIKMIKQGLDSSGADQITITYDKKHAESAPFTFRALTGGGPGEKGMTEGNMLLPSAGELGFMIRTKTPGLSTQILVNDHADGSLEKSAARDIIADGHWHLYSWQINSTHGWKNFVKGKGDNLVNGAFTLNSILVNGSRDASLSIDDVAYEEYPNNSTDKIEHLSYNGISTPSANASFSQINNVSYASGTLSLIGSNISYSSGTINLNTIGSNISYGTLTAIGGAGHLGTIDFNNSGIQLGKTGSGTFILNSANGTNAPIDLTGGTFYLGSSSGISTLTLDGGTLSFDSGAIGLIYTAGTVSDIPPLASGTISLPQGGTVTFDTGNFGYYPVAPGSALSYLNDNGAMLLSGGTFGAGGMLISNSGTLMLSDASVAPQFAQLQQSSGIAGTVLTPEPGSIILIGSAALLIPRTRRRRQTPTTI